MSKHATGPDATHRCSICKGFYKGFGNNARPVTNGRCCDNCNTLVVIPTRMRVFDAQIEARLKEDT